MRFGRSSFLAEQRQSGLSQNLLFEPERLHTQLLDEHAPGIKRGTRDGGRYGLARRSGPVLMSAC